MTLSGIHSLLQFKHVHPIWDVRFQNLAKGVGLKKNNQQFHSIALCCAGFVRGQIFQLEVKISRIF